MDDRSSSRRPQRQGVAPRSQRQQAPMRSQRGGRGMHMDMDVLNGRLAIFMLLLPRSNPILTRFITTLPLK